VDLRIQQAMLDLEKASGVDVTIPQALTCGADAYPNPISDSLSHSSDADDGELFISCGREGLFFGTVLTISGIVFLREDDTLCPTA
jgi:hypothetical protein